MYLLSICIPTYNNAEGLRSVLDNMLPLPSEVEIVVSDNASTDHTGDVLRGFMAIMRTLTIHTNDRNVGPARNFARLSTLATGKYVWLLSTSNNILTADTIKEIVEYIKTNDQCVMVVNHLFVAESCKERDVNIKDCPVMSKLPMILGIVHPGPILQCPAESKVFDSFAEVMDRFFLYFQWLSAVILRKDFFASCMQELIDADFLAESQMFCFVRACQSFPVHYLGELYILSIRSGRGKDAYYDRTRNPDSYQYQHFDFVTLFYEKPDMVLRYLADNHGVAYRPSLNGFMRRYADARFICKYAFERRKCVPHRADDINVMRTWVKLKRYRFLYFCIRFFPCWLLSAVWGGWKKALLRET